MIRWRNQKYYQHFSSTRTKCQKTDSEMLLTGGLCALNDLRKKKSSTHG